MWCGDWQRVCCVDWLIGNACACWLATRVRVLPTSLLTCGVRLPCRRACSLPWHPLIGLPQPWLLLLGRIEDEVGWGDPLGGLFKAVERTLGKSAKSQHDWAASEGQYV
eukprot:638891-Rhodomonas_salina.3